MIRDMYSFMSTITPLDVERNSHLEIKSKSDQRCLVNLRIAMQIVKNVKK